jgi:hypothetical protein
MTPSKPIPGLVWAAFALLAFNVLSVQAQTLKWLRQQGTPTGDFSYGVSADTLGNVYNSGATDANLGGAHFGASDAFVSKHDSNGTLRWTRQLGTSGNDRSFGVSAEGSDHIYIAGATEGLLGDVSVGGNDAFLGKYDASGTLLWTQQLGTTDDDAASSVSSDGVGSVYIAGLTSGSLGGVHVGDNDAFLSKYDASGGLQWTRQLGTTHRDVATSVSSDGLGSVYVAGITEGDLGIANAGGEDAFVSKFDSNGNLQWTRQYGTSDDDKSRGVSADLLGNVFVVGDTGGLTTGAWLSKYDSLGNLVWTRLVSSLASESRGVSADGVGNVFISGTIFNNGDGDAFVREYDTNGLLLWTQQIDIDGEDYWNGISANGVEGVFVSGVSGADPNRDVYVAKYSTVPEPATLALASFLLLAVVASTRRSWIVHSRCHLTAVPLAAGDTVSTTRTAAIGVAIALISALIALADHKPNHNSGGGGGSGGGSSLQFVDLHPPGNDYRSAAAINNSGIAVGQVDEVAGYWDTTATTPAFAPLAGNGWSADDINELGAIVGVGPAPTHDAYYWASPVAAPITLPLPAGFDNGFARGLSRDGIIVGEIWGEQTSASAAWRVNGSAVFGPVLFPSGSYLNDVASLGSGVNRIVGSSSDPAEQVVATAWDVNLSADGSFTVAGSTVLIPDQTSFADAITERGDVSGQVHRDDQVGANLNGFAYNAFVIRDELQILENARRERWGEGHDLNDTDVVGETAYANYADRDATRWSLGGKPEKLSETYLDESWFWSVAYGINDAGAIVGVGLLEGDDGRAWLLRPAPASLSSATVPEPSAIVLLALGTLLMGSDRRRRERQSIWKQ